MTMASGHVSLPLQKVPQELKGRRPVATRLDDGIEDFTLVVDCAPEIVELTPDPNEDFVQMPPIRRPRTSPADLAGVGATELKRPTAHLLGRDIDAAFGEQVLIIAIAQREPEIQPDGVLDDHGRKAAA